MNLYLLHYIETYNPTDRECIWLCTKYFSISVFSGMTFINRKILLDIKKT